MKINYEGDYNIIKGQQIIVTDIDGTLFDYKEWDKSFILSCFGENRIIKIIDRFAWAINSKDVFNNTYAMLKIRFFLYSIFVNKKYREILEEYNREYFSFAYREVISLFFSKQKYYILLTNNKVMSSLNLPNVLIISVQGSKKKALKSLKQKVNIEAFLGNSLFGDIIPAKIVGIPTIYVGRHFKILSKFLRFKRLDLKKIEEIIK